MRFFTLLALGLAGSAAALPAGSGSVTPTPTTTAVPSGTVAPSGSTTAVFPSPTAPFDPNAPPSVKHLQHVYYEDYHRYEQAPADRKQEFYNRCQVDLQNVAAAEASLAADPPATPTPSVPTKRSMRSY